MSVIADNLDAIFDEIKLVRCMARTNEVVSDVLLRTAIF